MPKNYLEDMEKFFNKLGVNVSSSDDSAEDNILCFTAALTPSEKPIF